MANDKGFVTTRFANVPVVAPTVPNVASEAFKTEDEIAEAVTLEAANVPPTVSPPVTV